MTHFVIERNISEESVALLRQQIDTLQTDNFVTVDMSLFTSDKLYLIVLAASKEVVRQSAAKAGLAIHRIGQIEGPHGQIETD